MDDALVHLRLSTQLWPVGTVGCLAIPAKLFHNGCPYHIETSPLIYRANQWTGFYMIGTSVMKELIQTHKLLAPLEGHAALLDYYNKYLKR